MGGVTAGARATGFTDDWRCLGRNFGLWSPLPAVPCPGVLNTGPGIGERDTGGRGGLKTGPAAAVLGVENRAGDMTLAVLFSAGPTTASGRAAGNWTGFCLSAWYFPDSDPEAKGAFGPSNPPSEELANGGTLHCTIADRGLGFADNDLAARNVSKEGSARNMLGDIEPAKPAKPASWRLAGDGFTCGGLIDGWTFNELPRAGPAGNRLSNSWLVGGGLVGGRFSGGDLTEDEATGVGLADAGFAGGGTAGRLVSDRGFGDGFTPCSLSSESNTRIEVGSRSGNTSAFVCFKADCDVSALTHCRFSAGWFPLSSSSSGTVPKLMASESRFLPFVLSLLRNRDIVSWLGCTSTRGWRFFRFSSLTFSSLAFFLSRAARALFACLSLSSSFLILACSSSSILRCSTFDRRGPLVDSLYNFCACLEVITGLVEGAAGRDMSPCIPNASGTTVNVFCLGAIVSLCDRPIVRSESRTVGGRFAVEFD